MRYLLPLISIVLLTGGASAQTIDSQGATELSETLAAYVGKAAFEKRILSVTADGDAYRIDLDIKALAALAPAQDTVTIEIAPYALRVKPLAGGTWQVDGPLFPNGWVEVADPNVAQRVEWTIRDGAMTGIYDPELATFSSATGSFAGLDMLTKDPTGDGKTSYGAGSITMSATKAAAGGVDFISKQVMADFVQSRTIAVEAGQNFPITMKGSSLTVDSSGSGVRTRALLDLLAFGVANTDEQKVKSNQAELRSLLLAALPLWENLAGSYALSGLDVNSPVGILRAGQIGSSMEMDGVRQDGRLSYDLNLSGLEIASLFMPKWAPTLIPAQIELNFAGTNLDLDRPARQLIESFDLNQTPPVPASVSDAIAAEFVASPPGIVIERSVIRNADVEIAAEGAVAFPGGKPVVDVTFDATGYDKVVAALQSAAAADPQAAQILAVAQFVEASAKTLPGGHLSWALRVNADGSVMLNTLTLKGPDPVTP